MNGDSDDPMIARLWRGMSSESPDASLDARIIRAARAQHQRRFLAPLATALAACLVLAFFVMQSRQAPLPPTQVAVPESYTFGLYEGRVLTDPEAAEQVMIRQMPGGSLYSEIVYP